MYKIFSYASLLNAGKYDKLNINAFRTEFARLEEEERNKLRAAATAATTTTERATINQSKSKGSLSPPSTTSSIKLRAINQSKSKGGCLRVLLSEQCVQGCAKSQYRLAQAISGHHWNDFDRF